METKANSGSRAGIPFRVRPAIPLAGLVLLLAAVPSTAQIYSVVHDFAGSSAKDGSSPRGGLVASGPTLFGTTWNGGSNNWGSVYRLDSDGTGYAVIKHFTSNSGGPIDDPLSVFDQTLYGTSEKAVYRVNADGSGFVILKNLASDNPNGPLVLSGTNLYGATYAGGSSNLGTIFRISADGNDYAVLKSFTGSEGANPVGGLLLADDKLYGTTYEGGISNAGVIFQLDTSGSNFTVLKEFTGSDGAKPRAGMLLSGAQLYGTTSIGGQGAFPTLGGTVFKLNTDGSGFTLLKDFSLKSGQEGNRPCGGLILSGSTLFGTTYNGGVVNPQRGTLFRMNTDGSNYAVLRFFNGDSFGANPCGNLVFINDQLYGTTEYGGRYGGGVVFAVSFAAPTARPECQTTEVGATARFTLEAPRFWSVNYQWFRDVTNPVSARLSLPWFRLTNAAAADAGLYTAVITQSGGALTSSPARLNVIPKVERRQVPAITVTSEPGNRPLLQYSAALGSSADWISTETAGINSTQYSHFDLSTPLPAQRFYRAWQTNAASLLPSLDLHIVPALTLTGSVGSTLRIEGINAIGPTDAWFTLATVTLTNTAQLYFDVSAPDQPLRLYRLVAVP